MTPPSSFLAVGAALVDVVTRVDDGFLNLHGLEAGQMHLLELGQARDLYAAVGQTDESAGGSCANTAAIAASLGADASFLGKTCDDQLGEIFWHDMSISNTTILKASTAKTETLETGRCLSLVTPNGQRTMGTYLGACQTLTIEDAHAVGVQDRTDWLFLEAYLLDTPNGIDLVRHLLAHHQGPIALTLSDARCVERHKAFLEAALSKLTLLLGNENEMAAMFDGDADNPKDLLSKASAYVSLAVCTNGKNGVYAFENGHIHHVPAQKAEVVDTTGAGDSFAGGVMYALCDGQSLVQGASLGVKVAAHIVSVVGARPKIDLTTLL